MSYFTTLTLNFTSWVVGTLPLTIADGADDQVVAAAGHGVGRGREHQLGLVLAGGNDHLGGRHALDAPAARRPHLELAGVVEQAGHLDHDLGLAADLEVGLPVASVSVPTVLGSTVIVNGVDGCTT